MTNGFHACRLRILTDAWIRNSSFVLLSSFELRHSSFALLFVEIAIGQADVEAQVGVAVGLEQFAGRRAARSRPVVVLVADRQLRFLVEINDAAMGVVLRPALRPNILDANAAPVVVLVFGDARLGAADL